MRIGLNSLGLITGKTGTAAAAFSPSSLFSSGQLGAWYDPSDLTTLWQDSAGTTAVTLTGQPIGKMGDKSGRGNHAIQATSTLRPLYTVAGAIKSATHDGVDDALAKAAPTLGASMDLFVAVKRNSTANGILCADPNNYAGCWNNTDLFNPTSSSVAAANLFVNGNAVTDDRQDFGLACPTSTWVIVEYRNFDFSAWLNFGMGNYTSTAFAINADIGGLILCPTQSAGVQGQIRTWLGAKVGLVL